ncbi:hypothetical protein GOBAR_AA06332 [Gossypium barbadense]|uniref:WAT1-related protein n=1 Tax=Gossypium barbadense TaxID=3634 RepID=A0A2P5YF94_GOSBA|nr:hypothetical protein GOBAR_AA06332 [Gossypium barbadense]
MYQGHHQSLHHLDRGNKVLAFALDYFCTIISFIFLFFFVPAFHCQMTRELLDLLCMCSLLSWAVKLKGPLYAAICNPLGLVLVAIVGSLLPDEKLHLGSIIGGLMIVCGVYVVLWGKATEMKQKTLSVPVPTVDQESNEIEEDEQRENTGTDEEQEHE